MAPNSPLNWNVPIVDKDGRPTAEFLLKWNEQLVINGDIPELDTPGEVSALLDILGATRGSLLVRTTTGWAILTPGTLGKVLASHGPGADPAWESLPGVQAYLDSISDVQGSVLYRGASAWSALAPGTAGYVLQTGGAGSDPSWVAQSGGGGGGTVPTVVQENTAIISSGNAAVTLGAAPSAGNLLVGFLSCWASSINLAPGWLQLYKQGTTSADNAMIVYKQVGAGESATQTMTATSTSYTAGLFEITDAALPSMVAQDSACSLTSTSSVTVNAGVPGSALGIGMFMAQARTAPTLTITGATPGSTANGTRSSGGPAICQNFTQTGLVKGAWQPSCSYSTTGTNGRFSMVLGPM